MICKNLKTIKRNKSLILLPILGVYLLFTLLFMKENLIGDESRYLMYANNLLNGFYSPPYPDISLWNGPGYPIFISFILFIGGNILLIRTINSLLLFFAVILFYRSIQELKINYKAAIIFSYLYAFFPPLKLTFLPLILTEIFSVFLVNLLIFLTIVSLGKKKFSLFWLLSVGVVLAYLAITKVIFAYVILMSLGFSLIIFVIKIKKRIILKRIIFVLISAFLFCVLYQIYTYKLTGNLFYWSNSGGYSFYWMSTPYQNEYGDWFKTSSFLDTNSYGQLEDNYSRSVLLARDSSLFINHGPFLLSLEGLNPIETDLKLKRKAIENIQESPQKFIQNWFANIGRFFFHYPYSYRDQTLNTYLILIPSMLILFIFCFILYPFIILFIKDHVSVKAFLVYFLLYFLVSSLLCAYSRMSILIFPIMMLLIISTWRKYITLKVAKRDLSH